MWSRATCQGSGDGVAAGVVTGDIIIGDGPKKYRVRTRVRVLTEFQREWPLMLFC